jgi:predicted lysophospholipase L1 biosynthesis ABC-type transport system permease subunit
MGTIISVLTLEFINLNHTIDSVHRLHTAPVLSFGILIIPLYDLLRVFSIRIIRKKSPFHPDKIHIHHKLLEIGMTHLQATFTLGAVNVLFIIFIFLFQNYNITLLMLAILILASLLTVSLWMINKYKKNKHVKN